MSDRLVSLRGSIPLVMAAGSLLVSAPVVAQDASPGPSSAPASAPAAQPLADASSPLAAGRYSDTSTGLSIELALGDGWSLAGGPIPDAGFALSREGPGNPYLGIVRFDGTVFADPCATAEDQGVLPPLAEPIEATARSFIEHVSAHPFVSASEPAPVDYAGLPGLAIDVTVDVPDTCDPPWAWLWALPVVGDYHLEDGQTSRLVALQAGDDVIVISSEVYEDGDLAAFITLTDGILDSLEVVEPS